MNGLDPFGVFRGGECLTDSFRVAQKSNSVNGVASVGRTSMSFEAFDEGTGNEMVPGSEVVHILPGACISLSIDHLATVEVECESLSGAGYGIKSRGRRGGKYRRGWALGFAITFPEGALGGE